MPILPAFQLQDLATRIFAAVGAPEADARWIATLLVRANLRGHDSHGVIRIPQYVGAVRKGGVNPRPTMTVLQQTATTAIVDGDLGFGQVVARHARASPASACDTPTMSAASPITSSWRRNAGSWD